MKKKKVQLTVHLFVFEFESNSVYTKQVFDKVPLVGCVLNWDLLVMFFIFSPFVQVHELDEQTWRTVEVVPIDISNKEEVAQGVSYFLIIK